MTDDQLTEIVDKLRSYPKEQSWFDFKINTTKPEQLGQLLCGIHNYAFHWDVPYGYIVFGVEDGTHNAIGTNIRSDSWMVGNENILFYLSQRMHPCPLIQLESFYYEGKHLLVLIVKNNGHEPVRYDSQYYYRIEQNTVCLNSGRTDILRELFTKAQAHIPFEDQLAADNLKMEEVLTLLETKEYYKLIKKQLPNSKEQIIKDFGEKGFIVPNGSTYSITNLGALTFASDLRKFSGLDGRRLRVVKYPGADKQNASFDHVGHFGYAMALGGAVDYVSTLVKTETVIQNGQRVTSPIYPVEALRELIANALIHQDFTVTGIRPTISVYENRIEITNPGVPPISTDRLIDEDKARNEKFAERMRELKLCERQGSGIDVALIHVGLKHHPAPKFVAREHQFSTTLFAPQEFEALDKAARIRVCFQHCVLQWIKSEKMNNESLRRRLGFDETKSSLASKVISDTVESASIKEFDPDSGYKFRSYVPYWA